MIYYVSIITLTWRDSSIKRWQFSTSTLYHPKFEWATLPSFRHFRHLHSSWKGFDSGIRMQGFCLVQCSGVRQQFLADQWSVQTIWIARWKGMDILKRGRDFLEEFSKAGKGYLSDMISTIYYVSIITLTWLDSSIKRWQFSTSTLYHPKFEWATLPSFRHFRHLHSSWKAFDSWIRVQRWCLPQCSVQCSGVHQQFLADQWSVPTTGDGKIEQRQDGRDVLEESSTPGKGYLWDLISMIYYISIITLKYSFESGVKTHGCLSHEFAKTMQQCWTCRRFKRVLVCRTTHHERSGCIIVQMLSFPSPSIYTTWDEPWHIRMHHFFGSKLRSPIDNGLW